MSTETTATEQSATAQPQDRLQQLAAELPREAERIAKQQGSAEQLTNELARTVLPMVQELTIAVIEFRNWAAYSHGEHAEHLDDHEARVSSLEESVFEQSTQMSQDDADLFSKIIAAAEAFAEQALVHTSDATGKAKLQEVLDLCNEARERIAESTVDDSDDDDSEQDDEDDGQDTEVAPTEPATEATS